MASCKTSQWVSTAPYVKLTVTQSSSTDTTATLSWKLEYIASSAANTNSARDYSVKIAGDTVKSGTFSIDGKKGTYTIASGTKTITKTTASQSIAFSCSFEFNLTWSGTYKGTLSASSSISVAAKTKYTVAYNANGGSGAPSSQTKWYGTALTLSSTKPTRTGYTFKGWATSASGSVAYASGASYTANAAVTLYAVWQINTYTVAYNVNGGSGSISSQTKTYGTTLTLTASKPTRTGYTFSKWNTKADGTGTSYASGASYTANAAVTLYAIWTINTYKVAYDANGGSGAPSSQTKTYGKTLTLSSTKPTKADYNFKGWATSANGSVVYAAGANYTADAAVTLYAVWELAYTNPVIDNLSVQRCDYDPTTNTASLNENGNFALVIFDWSTFLEASLVTIYYQTETETEAKEETVSISGTSGSVSKVIGISEDDNTIGILSTDSTYDVTVKVADGKDSTSVSKVLEGTVFAIDALKGGKGVAIGKPAELANCLDVNFDTYLRNKTVLSNGTSLCGKTSDDVDLSLLAMSTSNNTMLGYGLYDEGQGATNIYGNNVNVYSKNSTSVNSNVCIGNKTGYYDGNEGVYINKVGYMHLQRSSDGGNPYIGFILGSNKDSDGQIILMASNGYMKFANADAYQFDAKYIYFANGTSYYINSSGGANLKDVVANGATTLKSTLAVTGAATFNGDITSKGVLTIGTGSGEGGVVKAQLNLGTGTASDNTRYYVNGNATGRFNALRYTSIAAISSARRYKENIDYKDVDYWHEGLMNVKPCTYNYISGDDKETKIGVIAEDLKECLPELVEFNENGECETVYYMDFIIPLVAETQRLNKIVDEQQKEIDSLKEEMQQLKDLVSKLIS